VFDDRVKCVEGKKAERGSEIVDGHSLVVGEAGVVAVGRAG
jgi:hypothetical protein